MSETLLSALCAGDPWNWGSQNSIRFNQDGTGELWCQTEGTLWIGAELDWKAKNPGSLDQIIQTGTNTSKPLRHITDIQVEITLSKRCVRHLLPNRQRYRMNEDNLKDTAFRPKLYTIKLEEGNFVKPQAALHNQVFDNDPRYALRLSFDASPFPPQEEWKTPENGSYQIKMWEWTEFVGRESAHLQQQPTSNWTKAESDPVWKGCVVS